ncbi:MAG: hypothetical protein EA424_20725 [Planctomycetaceae bacterium]|nr:MAG: hypothetical protein EA424_20725 [Planctomycetaceae bacterium]
MSFQGLDLPVQQIVCLVDQANDGVGADFGAFVAQPTSVPRVAAIVCDASGCLVRRISRMGRIRQIGRIFQATPHVSNFQGPW